MLVKVKMFAESEDILHDPHSLTCDKARKKKKKKTLTFLLSLKINLMKKLNHYAFFINKDLIIATTVINRDI